MKLFFNKNKFKYVPIKNSSLPTGFPVALALFVLWDLVLLKIQPLFFLFCLDMGDEWI
jgi:hypothetical protein